MQSQKFIDTRTGEIVTQVPLSQIQHFEELTYQHYIDKYESGDWAMSAPVGPTAAWDREAWIAHIFGVHPF